jgi:lipopolysaccharide transport system ATP-binding protein
MVRDASKKRHPRTEMKPAIRVENLSKRYRVVTGPNGGTNATEFLTRTVKDTWRKVKTLADPGAMEEGNTFWALKDVSFEVQPGEVVGVIGRNGAGKSTLLKILSRIVQPTGGRAEIRGRMGSLLEVGTGFHAELTGRENVYLNGAVLGMGRKEIAKKFDAIVAFAGVEQFLDTPVKRYSSGMYVRLAFAVAAHLEPEILVVDEVLAVGDVEFQKKCLGKMEEVGKHGRAILFVSHNMSAINRLCTRAVLLSRGSIIASGTAHDVSKKYLSNVITRSAEKHWDDSSLVNENAVVRMRSVRICDNNGITVSAIDIHSSVHVDIEYDVLQAGWCLIPNCHFFIEDGTCLFVSHGWETKWRKTPKEPGRYSSRVTIPGNFFSEGMITVGPAITTYVPNMKVHCEYPDAVTFQVLDNSNPDNARGDYIGRFPGVIRPILDWQTTRVR